MDEKHPVFYTVKKPPLAGGSWVYSAAAFEETLSKRCEGECIKRMLVSLYGWLDAREKREGFFDFSYYGGTLLFLLESTALELIIHTQGIMRYRFIPLCEVEVSERAVWERSRNEAWYTPDAFRDVGEDIGLYRVDTRINGVNVERTDCYPFSISGFDESRAEEAEARNDLPSSVILHLVDKKLCLCGDEIEYFYLELV